MTRHEIWEIRWNPVSLSETSDIPTSVVEGATAYEKQLAWSREAKRKRTGTCRVCGTETRYGGGKGKPVSDLCHPCWAKLDGERRRGAGPAQARVLDFLSEPRRYSEIADLLDYKPSAVIFTLMDYGLIERVSRGVYVRVEK